MDALDSTLEVSDFSGYLALAALILSIVSLVWQIRRSWWEKPVVIVTGTQRALGSDADPTYHELKMVVTNVGERPVTLLDFGWYYGAGTHSHNVERPEVAVSFPLRLDPHGVIELKGFIDAKSAWKNPNQPLLVRDFDGSLRQGARPFVRMVRRPTRRELKHNDSGVRVVEGKPLIVYFTVGF